AGAPVHHDVATLLPLEIADRIGDVALQQRRVPVERLRERPRSGELGHPVERLGVFALLDLGPEFFEQFERDSTAEEGVALAQMIEGIALRLIVEVTVAPSAFIELLEPAWILDHPVKRDEG